MTTAMSGRVFFALRWILLLCAVIDFPGNIKFISQNPIARGPKYLLQRHDYFPLIGKFVKYSASFFPVIILKQYMKTIGSFKTIKYIRTCQHNIFYLHTRMNDLISMLLQTIPGLFSAHNDLQNCPAQVITAWRCYTFRVRVSNLLCIFRDSTALSPQHTQRDNLFS